MLSALVAASLPIAAPLESKVVAASLFKNGYAVVVREARFPGSGTWTLAEFPQAALGTLWITASAGVKLNEVLITTEETESERPVASMDEVLQLNLGKRLEFFLPNRGSVAGTLLSVSGAVAVIDRVDPEGKPMGLHALPKASISEVLSSQGDLIWKLKQKTSKRVLRFQAEAPGTSRLFVVALERGLTWAPTYNVDISDPKRLKIVSKATLLNDLADIENVELRLVTGFPNIPYIAIGDPFTTALSVDQWTAALMQAGTPEAYRSNLGMAAQMAGNVRLGERRDFAEAFAPSTLPGQQEEDLFFYRQPNVTLKKGDRGYYVLFSAESDYEHVYEWEIADSIQDTRYVERPQESEDVWHSLRFKNTSGRPFTTASAVTFKNGELLGQDMMRYTSAGADARLKITKALDIAAESAEEEIERKRDALNLRGMYYDLVTLKGALRMTNRKGEAVKLRVAKFLTGELLSADGNPNRTALAKGLRAVNPRLRLEWSVDLEPGENKSLAYTYSVYISR